MKKHPTPQSRSHRSTRLGALAALTVAATTIAATPARAQTAANADAMYKGYLRAYLGQSNGTTHFWRYVSGPNKMWLWPQAYEIAGVEDAYDRYPRADIQKLIDELLVTLLVENPKGVTDGWNDDLAWVALAMARGYRITGNADHLTSAKTYWDAAYKRGWNTDDNDGGILEVQGEYAKCTLSNAPFVPSAVVIYQADPVGNAAYLQKAKEIYAWNRVHLVDLDTGQVNECMHQTTLSQSTNAYNSGLMLNAAAILYRITGTKQYYDDAVLFANFQLKRYKIMDADYPNNGPFGGDQFMRGLSNFARWNGLWDQHSAWLTASATAAWTSRRTDYDIAHNKISTPTPGEPAALESMESLTPMVILQVTAIEAIVNAPKFSGKYEIQNANSKLAVAVTGASSASGAAVVQNAFSGGNDALWTLTPTSGGYYQIMNANSGLALEVQNASAVSGAAIIQLPAHGMRPGDDQWMPVLNADGTYTFVNLNSEQVFEVPKASMAAGTRLGQWFANGTNAQKFQLIPHQTTVGGAGGAGGQGGAAPAGGAGAAAGGGSAVAGVGGGLAGGGSGGGGASGTPSTLPGSQPGQDASTADGSGDAASSGGCACRASGAPESSGVFAGLTIVLALSAAEARRRGGRSFR